MTVTDEPQADEVGQLHLLPRRDAVLRMSEVQAAETSDQLLDDENDQTMLINMGPAHPSTHGVLRLMLEMDGEIVRRSKPIVGVQATR